MGKSLNFPQTPLEEKNRGIFYFHPFIPNYLGRIHMFDLRIFFKMGASKPPVLLEI